MREYQVWRAEGSCVPLPYSDIDRIFFISKGQKPKEAKELCSKCPVVTECLQYAVTYSVQGVWAGTTRKDRDALVDMGLVTPGVQVEEHNISKMLSMNSD